MTNKKIEEILDTICKEIDTTIDKANDIIKVTGSNSYARNKAHDIVKIQRDINNLVNKIKYIKNWKSIDI